MKIPSRINYIFWAQVGKSETGNLCFVLVRKYGIVGTTIVRYLILNRNI